MAFYGEEDEGEHRRTARYRTVIAKVVQFLTESDKMKVELEELELLLGPEDSEVDLKFTVMNAKWKKGRRIFQIFSTQGQCESLVVSAARWDEYPRIRARQEEEYQEEDYLEKCALVTVKIDLVESLLRPENLGVSLRYVLKPANYGSSNIFQLFDTTEKPNHLVASRRR